MITIEARNVEEALFTGLYLVSSMGERHSSRNGPMIEFPEPVTTVYRKPLERVVLDPTRDCNPFLHFFESLWMLSGSNELDFLRRFTKNMDQFSDDGLTLNGAYGYRWIHHFGYDQLESVIQILKKDPMSRRVVLSMWDGHEDLNNQSSKDLPCNTQVFFRLRDGVLDMTVINRSNDMIWGAYGANAVHFSYLQEYVAAAIGSRVGVYRQVSNSLHLYPGIPVAANMLQLAGASSLNHYGTENPGPSEQRLLQEGEELYQLNFDIERLLVDPAARDWDPLTDFIRSVAVPLYRAYDQHKSGADAEQIAMTLLGIRENDWRLAAEQWINRRRDAKGKGPLPYLA